ncbi:MAG: hypothetical protein KDA45_04220, partial [Planctomycetales bacterium]|nr:hypothetical protein [Planctomycetales bacterium]
LLTTPIFRFWKIKILAEPTAFSVDLATTSGDPLIVRHPLGEGSVTSVLSAPQVRAGADGWNAMAAWPSFVPLMQQLVQTAMDSGAEIHTVLAGQPLVGKVAAGRGSERGPRGNGLGGQPTTRGLVTITQPDGSQSQILSEDNEATGGATWVFTQTHRSGLYVVRDTAGNEQPYMVNIQPSESPLRSLGREQLPPSSERPPSLAVAGQDRLPLEETSPWLSRGLLLLLGVLLLSESLLAWWMGRKAG